MNILIKNCNILLIISLYFITIIYCQSIKLRMNLRKIDEYCLSEYFPDKTLVIYDVNSSSNKTRINLKFEKELKQTFKTNDLSLPIITEEGGNYELCILNVDTKDIEVFFYLKYGVAAKDYSSVAKAKDLKPVDLALEKLSDRAKDVSRLITHSQSNEKNFEQILDKISSKIMIFSLIVIFIMIFIGYIEFAFLKNFMRRRKII